FAGYSTCAIGAALCLGFHLKDNFRFPYAAIGFSHFWRRWHISLSTFLRDSLYIPLGANQVRPVRAAINLVIVMFLGGLWHGAAWTFVVWGLLHGVYLVVHAVLRSHGLTPPWEWVNRVITFVAVVAAFVVFRAASVADAIDVLSGMAGLHGAGVVLVGMRYALLVFGLLVFVNVAPNTWEVNVRPTPRVAGALGLIAAAAVLQIAE